METADNPLPDPFPGELRLVRLLGAGAFGKVWLADDLSLPRQVALKTVQAPDGLASPAQALAALRKDASFLCQVRHPNVVQVYFWRQVGEQHWLALQYVNGGSLGSLVAAGPLPWARAARYVADVAEGLLAVHAAGVVHRDVKPDNILLDADRDEALLTDFGISARLAAARTVAGTPAFMAPEAFQGRASESSDVYSLAATLFRLVTGEVPFPAKTWEELIDRAWHGLPEADGRCAVMPRELERIVRQGLAADAGRRPHLSAFSAELRGALNQALAGALTAPAGPDRAGASGGLRLTVRLREGTSWRPVATTAARPDRLSRDIKKVPPEPGKVRLHTGDTIRVEVTVDQPGYVTVFNVGPSGNLNLLYPEEWATLVPVQANQPLHVLDLQLVPPTGRERLTAVWSRKPLPASEVRSLVGSTGAAGPPAYRASRDIVRLQQAVQSLGAPDYRAFSLELEHVGPEAGPSP
jgi:hypothetical protein